MGKGCRGEAAASPKIWAVQIFWAAREIWAESIFKEVAFFFYVRIDLLHMLAYVSASYDPRFFSTVS